MIQNLHTLKSFMIEIINDANGKLSTATGFLYEHNNSIYLITNWHNVTGRNSISHDQLSKLLPTHFYVSLPKAQKQYNGTTITTSPQVLPESKTHKITIELYSDDIHKEPKWLEHEKGSEIDVIAIKIDDKLPENYKVHTVNNNNKFIYTMVGVDCIILGFPEDISIEGTPLWKKGMIASELEIDIDKLPKFYVDSITAKGMSGSPVFAIYPASVTPDGGMLFSSTSITPNLEFLGCYSGRINKQQLGAQMGIVWKEKAIQNIIDKNIPGKSSFYLTAKENTNKNNIVDHDLWVTNKNDIKELEKLNQEEFEKWKKINKK